MSDTNIIFGRKTQAARPKHFTPDPSSKKARKKRSDAKHDIKFKLSLGDKKALQLKSLDHQMPLTSFVSFVIKNELARNNQYDDFLYDNTGAFVHVVLEKDYYEMIKTLSVEWGMPYRRVVHRMIKQYLQSISGITIKSYREGM